MRIAVFHYKVTKNNPTGNCILQMLNGLYHEHQFTVFSADFQNPSPEHVNWIRVLVPTRPLALLFVAFHLLAPLYYLANITRRWSGYDLIIFTESRLFFGDVSYAHFCHRSYIREFWSELELGGVRRILRYMNHWLHALVEPWCFHRTKRIVVPSRGLKHEIEETYPFAKGKVSVIANPVNITYMTPPSDYDRLVFRQAQRVESNDLVLVFVALGNFEHKGLPHILEAMSYLADPRLRFWVVGGMADLVREWENKVRIMGLSGVQFFGMQKDVRPFMWGADVFVLPSLRETFPLVSLEAAAASLPLIVTSLYGVEEFMIDGEMGLVVKRDAASIAEGFRHMLSLSSEDRQAMGMCARKAVASYGDEQFVVNWGQLLSDMEDQYSD